LPPDFPKDSLLFLFFHCDFFFIEQVGDKTAHIGYDTGALFKTFSIKEFLRSRKITAKSVWVISRLLVVLIIFFHYGI